MSSFACLGSLRRRGTPAPSAAPESSPRKLGIEPLEHRELLASGLGWIPGLTDSPAARFVTGLYHDELQRVPLAGEVTGWVAALNAGQGHGRVAQGLFDSVESRTNFIQDTYLSLLGRTPARAEVDLWLHGLDGGMGDAEFQAWMTGRTRLP